MVTVNRADTIYDRTSRAAFRQLLKRCLELVIFLVNKKVAIVTMVRKKDLKKTPGCYFYLYLLGDTAVDDSRCLFFLKFKSRSYISKLIENFIVLFKCYESGYFDLSLGLQRRGMQCYFPRDSHSKCRRNFFMGVIK